MMASLHAMFTFHLVANQFLPPAQISCHRRSCSASMSGLENMLFARIAFSSTFMSYRFRMLHGSDFIRLRIHPCWDIVRQAHESLTIERRFAELYCQLFHLAPVHEWHKSWRILSQTLNFSPTSRTVEKKKQKCWKKASV